MTNKRLEQFTTNLDGDPSGPDVIDVGGSTQDTMFAKAILATEPTSVLEQSGIVTVQTVPVETDEVTFPVMKNTQLTWREVDYRNSTNVGSKLDASQMNAVSFEKVRPTIQTANIFIPYGGEQVNKIGFKRLANSAAVDAKRKKEEDGMTTLVNGISTNDYAANSFTQNGSVDSGSSITLLDLSKAKEDVLSIGSDTYSADYALLHPVQFRQLSTEDALSPGATSPGAIERKAEFNGDGDLIKYHGMDIVVSELVPSIGSNTLGADITDNTCTVLSHPVVVGERGKSIGRGQHSGIRVKSKEEPEMHGVKKILDMSYANTVLDEQSMVKIKSAD